MKYSSTKKKEDSEKVFDYARYLSQLYQDLKSGRSMSDSSIDEVDIDVLTHILETPSPLKEQAFVHYCLQSHQKEKEASYERERMTGTI